MIVDVVIDGSALTLTQIARVAAGTAGVRLDPSGRARAARSAALAARTAAVRPVYGRTTGVGANRDVAVGANRDVAVGANRDVTVGANRNVDVGANGDVITHGLALLRSHATAAGPVRSPARIRAMLVIRLNQLAAGGSGVSPGVLDGLERMLTEDALPIVYEIGSIGTGDLAALAATLLALTGEGPTSNPLSHPIHLDPADALPVMSSNAATIADAALACVDLAQLARATLTVGDRTFTAVRGNHEAFSRAVERVTPFEGARAVCRVMRALGVDRHATVNHPAAPARIQDPFALRTFPQVHGAFLDALAQLDRVITVMSNAPSENPVFLPGEGAATATDIDTTDAAAVAHHGGFHGVYLAQALDAVNGAAAQSAHLSAARLALLVDPEYTGRPAFLGDGTPGASGVMACEYVAASALGTLRARATPAGGQSVTLSRGVEDDASFASLAACNALDGADAYRVVLACELVAAVRALRAQASAPDRGPRTTTAELPDDATDRDLTVDLAIAQRLMPVLADEVGPDEHPTLGIGRVG